VIGYLVTAEHAYTMKCYLRTWGIALARRITVLPYEDLPPADEVKVSTWIFSDHERLTPARAKAVSGLWAQLSESQRPIRLLNEPGRVLQRFELLRLLHERRINDFRAFRLAELPRSPRFPVFLRREHEHSGALSELLYSQEALNHAVAQVRGRGDRTSRLLVVEFCDTSDSAGIFRRYAAFSVGGRIVPREVNFSRNWMLRDIDLLDREKLEEERAYVTENPHESQLRELFRMANVEYGRVDYALLDGKPQVWEMNTNPMVMLLPWCYKLRHLSHQWRFSREIRVAFEALDKAPIQERPPATQP
jgi:hypothetical protein